MQNIGAILNWCHHHWLHLVLLPANILTIEAIVRQAAVNAGYKNAVTWCDRIAKFVGFVGEIIAGIISRKPPQPPKAAALILFMLIGGSAFSQTTPVSISSVLSKLTMHEAVGYDIKSKNAVSYTSADLFDWNMLSLSAGYSTSSAIVASADVDLGGLSQFGITSPLLSIIDLRVGFMVGLSDISTATSGGTAERNKLCYGPEITIVSTKF